MQDGVCTRAMYVGRPACACVRDGKCRIDIINAISKSSLASLTSELYRMLKPTSVYEVLATLGRISYQLRLTWLLKVLASFM